MTTPYKTNLAIYQGSTFNQTIRWESTTKVYKDISAIGKSAPMVVTATSHGLLAGWRAKLSNVSGMTEANSLGWLIATTVDSNTVTFNSVNAAGFKNYTSGGILEYNAPVGLAGYSARMQIREKLSSTTTLLSLTSDNLDIDINNVLKTITVHVEDTVTANLDFKTAIYSLEMISPTNVVTTLMYGNVSLIKEITR